MTTQTLRDALEKLIENAGDQYSVPQIVPIQVVSVAALRRALREAAPVAEVPAVIHCKHCGDPITQFYDDSDWSSLGDFGGTGTGALMERQYCVESPDNEHSPADDPESAALAVLKAHRLISTSAEDATACSCGWESETATRDLEEHEEHVAAMLGAWPLLDREAVLYTLTKFDVGGWKYDNPPAFRDRIADSLMKLAQPMPSRDQLAGAIHPECTSSPSQCPNWEEALKSADRVLALIPINHELIDLDKVFNGSKA